MAESMGASSGWVEGLSESQEVALAALRAGGTFAKAAEAAGVNRTTVYRWVHGDPHFRAAYNAWQQAAAESARARLTQLADLAVDDASSPEPRSEAAGETIGPNENGNSMTLQDLQSEPAGPEGPERDASSDATSEGMLHESVA